MSVELHPEDAAIFGVVKPIADIETHSGTASVAAWVNDDPAGPFVTLECEPVMTVGEARSLACALLRAADEALA